MNIEERRMRIYNLIKVKGEVIVAELADSFAVSTMTIRRDLDSLENSGLIRREYGKALLVDDTVNETNFHSRSQNNHYAKIQIAAAAVRHMKNVSSIYIDGSSTAYEFIRALPPDRRLTVFTNSAIALQYLSGFSGINVFVMGGLLARDNNTLDSEVTANIAKNIFVDATVISCSGFSAQGFFNDGITGSQIKKIMLENSQHNYLLADCSKFNSQGVFRINTWDAIDTLICDRPFDETTRQRIADCGVEVVYCATPV